MSSVAIFEMSARSIPVELAWHLHENPSSKMLGLLLGSSSSALLGGTAARSVVGRAGMISANFGAPVVMGTEAMMADKGTGHGTSTLPVPDEPAVELRPGYGQPHLQLQPPLRRVRRLLGRETTFLSEESASWRDHLQPTQHRQAALLRPEGSRLGLVREGVPGARLALVPRLGGQLGARARAAQRRVHQRLDGTHLGHNLPDGSGNRYCINLVSVAGRPLD